LIEPRALFLEERANGTVLVGRWPEMAIIDQDLITEACHHKPDLGEDFDIVLANTRARYRYVEDGERATLVCLRIR
jgi:hypothetical protein